MLTNVKYHFWGSIFTVTGVTQFSSAWPEAVWPTEEAAFWLAVLDEAADFIVGSAFARPVGSSVEDESVEETLGIEVPDFSAGLRSAKYPISSAAKATMSTMPRIRRNLFFRCIP